MDVNFVIFLKCCVYTFKELLLWFVDVMVMVVTCRCVTVMVMTLWVVTGDGVSGMR